MPHSARAIITFLGDDGQPVDPGFGVPGFGSGRPDNSLPGAPAYPSHGLPGGPVQLPVYPFDPTLGPDNELPDTPSVWPPRPGNKFLVKYLACVGLILVPDNSLPDSGQGAQPK